MDQHQDTLLHLDELIAQRSITQHPFYVAWRAGELTRQQLAIYAQIYYPHVAAFPGYLQMALQDTNDPQIRAELELNLYEELGEPKAHPELWLDFAEGLDLERGQVTNAATHPAALQTVTTFQELASDGNAQALAALYAYESQQPEVARQKADGLRELYGINNPTTLAYFEVHAEADLRHRSGERAALARALSNGATEEQILLAAGRALEAYWGLLDGVCAETGLA